MTSSTTIRNNEIKPYLRNAMLVRAHNMNIEGNHFLKDGQEVTDFSPFIVLKGCEEIISEPELR